MKKSRIDDIEKAEEQLRFIKSILDSKVVRRYFPGLIHPEEGRREAWNKTFIVVDHEHRKREGVVDSTLNYYWKTL